MRDEYQVTSEGLLIWLSTWSMARHSTRDREQCKVIPAGILARALRQHDFYWSAVLHFIDGALDECPARGNSDNPCRHVRYALRKLGNSDITFSWYSFTEVLVDFLSMRADCPAASLAFEFIKDTVCVAIDKYALEMPKGSILHEPMQLSTPTGKRRRIDEDFKTALMNQGIGADCVKASTILRFTKIADQTYTQTMMSTFLKMMRESSKRSMTCTGVVLMSDDASAHGVPAEDTNVSLVVDATVGIANYGPPMVRICVLLLLY